MTRAARTAGGLARSVALALGLAACGAGAPTGPTTGALALHYDSLAIQARAAGDGVRAEYLREMTVALARGVRPAPVGITANGVTRRFEALGYEGVVARGDSSFVVIAWDGWDPSAFVLAHVSSSGAAVATVTYTPDSVLLQSDSGTVMVSRLGVGGGCSYAALHSEPFGPGMRCARQSMSWSFGVRVRALDGTGAAVRLEMAPHAVPGVRLDMTPRGGGGSGKGITQVAER